MEPCGHAQFVLVEVVLESEVSAFLILLLVFRVLHYLLLLAEREEVAGTPKQALECPEELVRGLFAPLLLPP